jgi:hypothetical protein
MNSHQYEYECVLMRHGLATVFEVAFFPPLAEFRRCFTEERQRRQSREIYQLHFGVLLELVDRIMQEGVGLSDDAMVYGCERMKYK